MVKPSSALDTVFLSFQAAIAGRYSIDRELGRGGMGIVYLAREVHLDRLVAIKLLPPERAADAALREHFVREARLAAKLSHPNVIPIHSVDEIGGFVFYVMAFVDGETLTERVRTRGPLSGSDGARILREVAWALAHAHSQGLIHRDVKPDNILLEHGSGRALVADFGIAAVAGDASAATSGTPEFMSPEQALAHPLDARSDIYSLGVTAFFAFSGRLPFEGSTATEILARHITEPAPGLASLGLSVPRKVAQLVDRCLAKNPDSRPATADAVGEQLAVALVQRRELPVALRAFVKRNGRLDGGGSLLATFAVGVCAISASAMAGGTAGLSTLVAGFTLGPMAYLIHSARRLSRLGFAHADLLPAFRNEIDQAREEHAVEHSRGPTTLEKTAKTVARIFGAGFVGSVGVLLFDLVPIYMGRFIASSIVGVTGVVGCGAALAYLAMLQRRRDVDTEFWARVWTGPIGRVAFTIAQRLSPGRGAGAAMTHRATELSLGLAAEQLYESLPKDTRRALADLPAILGRLQSDAQRLRLRYDGLQDALGSLGEDQVPQDVAELTAERDAVHARLGEAVGALETIRLNLLRLHAGSATVESMTTHLGLASDVSAQIERLIAAHEEVEGSLRRSPDAIPTPA
jgi:eukaryotic-like serine/threonine-protein kinase